MEHFSIISSVLYLYLRVRIREGTTKFVIKGAILAKNNVIAWEFRGWYFVKRASARERDLWISRETFKFLKGWNEVQI